MSEIIQCCTANP